MAHIIAVCNQKGGVGKTTTAVNLAASLAAAEKRTLLIDMDPQGNSGSGVSVDKHQLEKSIYDVLNGNLSAEEVMLDTGLQWLKLIPSNVNLVGAEIELTSVVSRETRLLNGIKPLRDQFDYMILDCPPSLGLLTLNALTAADGVLIPVQCEYYAMEGMADLMQTIELVQTHLNPRLVLFGILLTMFDKRNNLSRQVAEEIRKHFKEKVFTTVIPRNVRLSEAPSHGKPVLLYDIRSVGARMYLELVQEILLRTDNMLSAGGGAEATARRSNDATTQGIGQGALVTDSESADKTPSIQD